MPIEIESDYSDRVADGGAIIIYFGVDHACFVPTVLSDLKKLRGL
jgi:hypothetical protein